MSDLISRQAAIDAVKGRFSMPVDNLIAEVIGQLPSAQPEQKKGEWIESGYWSEGVGMGEVYGCKYRCSECGTEVNGGEDRCGVNFCPNCGAKMVANDE